MLYENPDTMAMSSSLRETTQIEDAFSLIAYFNNKLEFYSNKK